MSKEKNKKIIGLDLDGVIVNQGFNRERLAREFGYALSLPETVSDVFKRKLPPKIYRKIDQAIYHDPVLGLTPPAFEGVKEGLLFLRQAGLPYFLISRRQKPAIAVALLQKRKLWPDYFDENNVFFVQDAQAKNEKAKALGVSIYLDDELAVLEALVDVPHRFLFDRYGIHGNREDLYQKVSSWPDFIEKIKKV